MSRLTLPLALGAALALAACGVKGPLEPPPGAPQPSAQPQARAQTPAVVVPPPSNPVAGFHAATSASDMANTATPHADWEKSQRSSSSSSVGSTPSGAAPNRPFILDGLL